MNSPESDHPQSFPLWQFVPLREYQIPTAPAQAAFRLGFHYFWSKLKQYRNSNEQSQATEFQGVPLPWLDRIAPPISWDGAATALANSLDEWELEGQSDSSVQVIIGPPGGGSLEIATRWAKKKGWSIVPTPTPDQIFSSSNDWLDQCVTTPETPRVLLGLERFYLRHHNGLKLVRLMKESLENTQARCLVQCDSWGWAYLNKALDLTSSLPEPWVLKALDLEHLQQWLQAVIAPGSSQQQVREIGSNKLVLSIGSGDTDQYQPVKKDDNLAVSNFLEYLVGHSRGIPELAREIWRLGLRIPKKVEPAGIDGESINNFEDQTLWVSPWPELELPKVPNDITQCQSFLLHAILIHGGLDSGVFPELVPFSRHDIWQSLHQLRHAGLLKEDRGRWNITILGYPSIRQYLNNQGFLVDSF